MVYNNAESDDATPSVGYLRNRNINDSIQSI